MNIKPTGKGSYECTVSVQRYTKKENDKRKLTGKTKAEVREKYITLMSEMEKGMFSKPSNATFADYLEKYSKRKKQQVTEETHERYERLWRLHILPTLGHVKINKITPVIVQNFFDELAFNKKFVRKSCNLVKTILNGVFKIALNEGVIKENPVKEDLELPKNIKKEQVVWNEVQLNKFIDLRHRSERKRGVYYTPILTCFLTAMRIGEVLGLTWDRVDLDKNVIYVRQTMSRKGEIKPRTKSGEFRQIQIDDVLKEELIRHKEWLKTYAPKNPLNLVFCTYSGKRIVFNSINQALDKYCEKLELPRINLHGTRHTNATILLDNGETILTVQTRLGHSKPSMTLDVYSHAFKTQQDSAVQTLNKIFKK